MRVAVIQAIEHHLPVRILTNDELATVYPSWTAEKIFEKTGIRERRIVAEGETASDLAVAAAEKVIGRSGVDRADIDLVVYCTQSPDYALPTTACLIQDRLGLRTTTAAFDFNLGCSAYPYGLAIVRGFIETGAASTALLVMADTYSRYIHPLDKSVRTLFGDAGSATLVTASDRQRPSLGPFLFGTDGSGAQSLIVPRGGARAPFRHEVAKESVDASGNVRTDENLFMDGPAIFEFSVRRVPGLVTALLERAELPRSAVRYFIFHQGSEFLLSYLQKKMAIPDEQFPRHFAHCGNTVSSTIPIVIQNLVDTGRLDRGDTLMCVGFGVGYSWGANVIRWEPDVRS